MADKNPANTKICVQVQHKRATLRCAASGQLVVEVNPQTASIAGDRPSRDELR